jgi:hypothetical protein
MSYMRFSAGSKHLNHGTPHPLRDAEIVADSLRGIHNVTVKFLFIANRNSIGVSTGTNPEDLNLESVEVIQWASSTYPSVLIGVIENISHSAAKICRSIIMHVPHSCSDCQWYIFQ